MIRNVLSVWLLLVCACAAQVAPLPLTTHYLNDNDIDAVAILPTPPQDKSRTTRKELDQLLEFQEKRTLHQIRRCSEQAMLKPDLFREVMGRRFTEDFLPKTFELLISVNTEVAAEVDRAKLDWKRPRPNKLEPKLHPCVSVPPNTAYPSGHAAISVVLGKILCEIAPEKTPAIIKMANEIGMNRVIAGLHYPSDYVAGQKLGDAIFECYMQKEAFRRDLEIARAECLAKLYK